MAQSPMQYNSLISLDLQEASAKQHWRINRDEVRHSDSGMTQNRGSTTISIFEMTTSEDVLELHSTPPLEPKVVTSKGSGLTTRQKWGYTDPPKNARMPILSKFSQHTTIQKGFGRFILENEAVVFKERVYFYPPLPNAAYNFLNKNIGPSMTPATHLSSGRAALVREKVEYTKLASQETNSLGEQTANWTHRLYSGGDVSSRSTPGFCISYWRDDLVHAIDNAKALGDESFEMCKKCQKRHIACGPSVAMHDRDTCFGKLPIWFPAEEFEEPWNVFTQIINKVVRFEEIRQGRLLDPNRQVWDKSNHEGSEEWTAPGRKSGGWWKCRNGNTENETDVPPEERNCRLCHRAESDEELAFEANTLRDIEEEARTHAWIERCMETQTMKDKA